MERRSFIKLGFAAGASGLLLPSGSLAGITNHMVSPLAGSVFYTSETPGRWAGKQGAHAPNIEVSGSKIEVITGHVMDGYEHYIVKHVLLDENLKFVAETMFDPEADSPISSYDLGDLKNSVYAISLCNKHDAWLGMLELEGA